LVKHLLDAVVDLGECGEEATVVMSLLTLMPVLTIAVAKDLTAPFAASRASASTC
jgi:hypothetical protein